MMLLSIKWASRGPGDPAAGVRGEEPADGAKGMVLSGLITTPFAFLWILPGLAAGADLPARVDEPRPRDPVAALARSFR